MIVEAERELARRQRAGRLGRFQLEAAIQSVHAQRAVTGSTNWEAVAMLYDGLVALSPTIGALVGRAAAIGEALGAGPGFAALGEIPLHAVTSYQPYWAVRAHLLARLGDPAAAGLTPRPSAWPRTPRSRRSCWPAPEPAGKPGPSP